MELNSAIENLKRELLTLLDCSKCDFSQHSRAIVPSEPGIYAIYEKSGCHLLYVGTSGDLKRRLFTDHLKGEKRGSAFRRKLSAWQKLDKEVDITDYISSKCEFQFKQCGLADAERLEHFAIAVLEPLLDC